MLDASIDRLERRLATLTDSDRAWDYFNADNKLAAISDTEHTRISQSSAAC